MQRLNLSGPAMLAGGVLTGIDNAVLSPMLPVAAGTVTVIASPIFLARLSVAALGVFCLLCGLIGIDRRQSDKVGWFGANAFRLSFAGTAMVFAHEWAQVFYMHQLALVSPVGLSAIDNSPLLTLEVMLALPAFALGWIMLCASMLISGRLGRIAPALVIIGFFAIPVFGVLVHGLWGQIIGNLVLSSGWALVGWQLTRPVPG